MKKLIAILVVFTLAAGAAFAEFYTGFWGRTTFTAMHVDMLDNGDTGISSWTGQWSNDVYAEMFFQWSGDHFGAAVNIEAGNMGIAGHGKMWWEPNDMFKMTVGRARFQDLRGTETFDSFAGPMGWDLDVDQIFPRLNTNQEWFYGAKNGMLAGTGTILELYPIENLTVAAAVINPMAYAGDEAKYQIADVLKQSQYVVGYQLTGVGLFRAGYFGLSEAAQGYGFHESASFAFQTKAVPGLVFDIGLHYNTNHYEDANFLAAAFAANYHFDLGDIPTVINFYFNGQFGGNANAVVLNSGGIEAAGVPLLSFYLNPVFDLGFADLGLGVGMNLDLLKKDEARDITGPAMGMMATAWLKKVMGGGSFKAGVIFGKDKANDMHIAIPLEIEVSVW